MEITSLIKSTKLKQLTKRLSISSLENIYEIADQGYFGLYVKPCLESQYNLNIDTHFNKVLKNAHSEDEKNALIELHAAYLEFLEKYPHLLVPKPGYERLATTLETKIWTLCNRSSINQLNTHGKIIFPKHATAFGFIKINNNIISNAYHLRTTPTLEHPPENYKGYYSEDDIFAFIDQIEFFEHEINNCAYTNITVQHTPTANLPKVSNRGKNHMPKRLLTIRYGIAVLLSKSHAVINGGKGITYLVSKCRKQEGEILLGEIRMTNLFNDCIKIIEKQALVNEKDSYENLHMVILSVTFQLRKQHYGEESFLDLIINESQKTSNKLKITSTIDQIKSILNSSALLTQSNK